MKPFVDSCKRWRHLILLGMLLLLLVVQPIALGHGSSARWFEGIFFLVVLSVLYCAPRERRWRLLAFAVGIPAAVLPLTGVLIDDPQGVLVFGHLVGALLLLLVMAAIVKTIMTSQQLTLDSVFGAICGYLLLGVAWGLLYSVSDYLWPGSFTVPGDGTQSDEPGRGRIHLLIYYSMVTLTTVGYGDVTPVSPAARTLAWLEAMAGQFYLAILVAGLVGALISRKGNRAPDPGHRER